MFNKIKIQMNYKNDGLIGKVKFILRVKLQIELIIKNIV